MTGPVFVDSNVFLYAFDQADRSKHLAAKAWGDELWRSRLGRISFQVLQEFYANAISKWPENREEARSKTQNLLAWQPVTIDAAILQQGWKLQDRFQLSFWDALIVAAAKSAGCRYLLTEDMQANQDMDGLRLINPFHTDPSFLYRA